MLSIPTDRSDSHVEGGQKTHAPFGRYRALTFPPSLHPSIPQLTKVTRMFRISRSGGGQWLR